jgi:hypothetical protein
MCRVLECVMSGGQTEMKRRRGRSTPQHEQRRAGAKGEGGVWGKGGAGVGGKGLPTGGRRDAGGVRGERGREGEVWRGRAAAAGLEAKPIFHVKAGGRARAWVKAKEGAIRRACVTSTSGSGSNVSVEALYVLTPEWASPEKLVILCRNGRLCDPFTYERPREASTWKGAGRGAEKG